MGKELVELLGTGVNVNNIKRENDILIGKCNLEGKELIAYIIGNIENDGKMHGKIIGMMVDEETGEERIAVSNENRKIYPLPYRYYKELKVRKYGFHGMSHKYVSERISQILDNNNLKIINCHLGQGASICAIKDGKSQDISMGSSPVAGIPMGTRAGDLDPSIVTFLMKKENLSADEIMILEILKKHQEKEMKEQK